MEKEIIEFKIPKLGFNISTLMCNPNEQWRNFHIHNAVEMVRPDSYSVIFETQNTREELTANHVLLVNSNVPHRLSAADGTVITYIQIDMNARQSLGRQSHSHIHDFITRNTNLPYTVAENPSELFDIFSDLRRETEIRESFFTEYISADISRLHAIMLRHGILTGLDHEQLLRLENLMPVIEYTEAHFSEHISLEKAAAVANRTKFSLCREFKAATGGTFVDFLNFVRLKNAEVMLKDTQKSILDISFECGFSSILYFNKMFKEYLHCTPGSLRRNFLNNRL